MDKLLIAIISAITATAIAMAANYINNRNGNKNRQDEQTKWVDRLVKIVNTPDREFKQSDLLEILSCLRPFSKVRSHKSDSFDYFTEYALQYCSKRKNNTYYSIDECNNFRMIANVLLKNHWEHLSYESKLIKLCPQRLYMAIKFDSIAANAIDTIEKSDKTFRNESIKTLIHPKLSNLRFVLLVFLFIAFFLSIFSYFFVNHQISYYFKQAAIAHKTIPVSIAIFSVLAIILIGTYYLIDPWIEMYCSSKNSTNDKKDVGEQMSDEKYADLITERNKLLLFEKVINLGLTILTFILSTPFINTLWENYLSGKSTQVKSYIPKDRIYVLNGYNSYIVDKSTHASVGGVSNFISDKGSVMVISAIVGIVFFVLIILSSIYFNNKITKIEIELHDY